MASAEPLFDPSLKKRKKKTVAFNEDPLGADADPTTPAPEIIESTTTNGDAVNLGPATAHELMKAKAEEGGEQKSEVDDLKAMFGDMKKKKKSTKKKAAFDLEAFEKELNDSKSKSANADDDDDDVEVNTGAHLDLDNDAELGDNPFAQEVPVGVDAGTEAWLKSDRDYTYQELLTRFYSSLHAANPSLLSTSGQKRHTIAPPQIHREGNKKSIFANVTDICKRMHRQPEHVIQFLFSEMGTHGSVDGAGRLVIKGRFQQKQVENVLRRYIVEYVTCKTCKSHDTLLTKENRIFFMTCESCGSRRSVNPIKSGFQAQVGKRSKNKTG